MILHNTRRRCRGCSCKLSRRQQWLRASGFLLLFLLSCSALVRADEIPHLCREDIMLCTNHLPDYPAGLVRVRRRKMRRLAPKQSVLIEDRNLLVAATNVFRFLPADKPIVPSEDWLKTKRFVTICIGDADLFTPQSIRPTGPHTITFETQLILNRSSEGEDGSRLEHWKTTFTR